MDKSNYSVVVKISIWRDTEKETEDGPQEDYELVSEEVNVVAESISEEVPAYLAFLEAAREISSLYEKEIIPDAPHHTMAYTNTLYEFQPHPLKLYYVELHENGKVSTSKAFDEIVKTLKLTR